MLSEFIKSTLAPIGAKLTGAINSIGHKISHAGRGITSFIDKIPVVREVARPLTSLGNTVLDVVDGVTSVSDSLNKAFKAGDTDAAAARLGEAATNTSSLLRRRT